MSGLAENEVSKAGLVLTPDNMDQIPVCVKLFYLLFEKPGDPEHLSIIYDRS